VEFKNLKRKTKMSDTFFHCVRTGNFEKCKLLIKEIDVNQATFYDGTPLYYASEYGNFSVCELLISKGANVNQTTTGHGYDLAPLHIASERGYIEICKLLIEKGANVNQTTNRCLKTPLHFASGNGFIEICKFLIEKGAKVNQATNNGETPLFIACKYGHIYTCKFLISKGANINQARIDDWDTPLLIAHLNGHTKVYNFLKEYRLKVIYTILLGHELDENCFIYNFNFPSDLVKHILRESGYIGKDCFFSVKKMKNEKKQKEKKTILPGFFTQFGI